MPNLLLEASELNDPKLHELEVRGGAQAALLWLKLRLWMMGRGSSIIMEEDIPMLARVLRTTGPKLRKTLELLESLRILLKDPENFFWVSETIRQKLLKFESKISGLTSRNDARNDPRYNRTEKNLVPSTDQEPRSFRKESAERKPKPKKLEFGDGEVKVLLTEAEHEKLLAQFGESGTRDRIKRLSYYINSKGKKYKSHYFTILSWAQRDAETNGKGSPVVPNGGALLPGGIDFNRLPMAVKSRLITDAGAEQIRREEYERIEREKTEAIAIGNNQHAPAGVEVIPEHNHGTGAVQKLALQVCRSLPGGFRKSS